MDHLRFAATAMLAALAAGCAVSTTGAIPTQDGMYTITRQGEGFWVQPMQLTAAATQEADSFCRRDRKTLKMIHVKEIPAGIMGRWPESEVLFRCD